MNTKEILIKLDKCSSQKLLKPLAEKPWQAGRYPLVECLSREDCGMRVQRKDKPPVCTAVWEIMDETKNAD
jgi:hypothetical protein